MFERSDLLERINGIQQWPNSAWLRSSQLLLDPRVQNLRPTFQSDGPALALHETAVFHLDKGAASSRHDKRR